MKILDLAGNVSKLQTLHLFMQSVKKKDNLLYFVELPRQILHKGRFIRQAQGLYLYIQSVKELQITLPCGAPKINVRIG